MLFLQDILLDSLAIIVADFQSYHGGVRFGRNEDNQADFSSLTKAQQQWFQTPERLQMFLAGMAPDGDTAALIQLVVAAFGAAVFFTVPLIIESCEKLGGEWSRCVLDHMRYLVFAIGGYQYLDLSKYNDKRFRTVFESEWKRLLQYSENFYGFRVVPKLSLEHLILLMKKFSLLKGLGMAMV